VPERPDRPDALTVPAAGTAESNLKLQIGTFTMEQKKVALKMIVDGKEKDITFEELALSNNLAQEALVRVLIDKKLLEPKDLLDMMETVKKERYRHIEEK